MRGELTELALRASWPPRRDKMRYDADWQLHIKNLWRVVALGIPSVFW